MSRIQSLCLIFFFISIQAQGSRTVVLTSQGSSSPIQVTNPSPQTVDLDLQCFDAGGSVTVNESGITLDSKKSYYLGGPTCASGYSLESSSSSFSSPLYICKKNSGTVNFSGAQSACGTNNLCTFQQIQTHHGSSLYNNFSYWFVPGVTQWSYDNTGSYFFTDVNDGTTTSALTTSSTYSYLCKNEPASSSGVSASYCKKTPVSSAAAGALCCENTQGIAYCRVTINSTNPNAYLTSPQFKGGAPF